MTLRSRLPRIRAAARPRRQTPMRSGATTTVRPHQPPSQAALHRLLPRSDRSGATTPRRPLPIRAASLRPRPVLTRSGARTVRPHHPPVQAVLLRLPPRLIRSGARTPRLPRPMRAGPPRPHPAPTRSGATTTRPRPSIRAALRRPHRRPTRYGVTTVRPHQPPVQAVLLRIRPRLVRSGVTMPRLPRPMRADVPQPRPPRAGVMRPRPQLWARPAGLPRRLGPVRCPATTKLRRLLGVRVVPRHRWMLLIRS
ncbi:hypothetical protein EV138_0350 [Kribbella voronezhensis]|uniref:Uncharacterized protein n=1 Tax=Kribbella voronezhensis TaxID=2512212 RepID=A0A4R7T4S3_9ACTN|nr:hypothetical protein EV138_0350 [Kribbella voronezhensis]